MNSLVITVFATVLLCGSVSGGVTKPKDTDDSKDHTTKSPSTKRSLPVTSSVPVYPETTASHHGWAAPGYSGPIAVPELKDDGTIADTPEVAAARAAHLAALAAARAANPDMDDGHYDPHKYGDHHYGVVSHADNLLNNILFYESLAKGHQGGGNHVDTENAHSQAKASANAEAALAVWKAKQAEASALWQAQNSGGISSSYGVPVEQIKPYSGPLAMLELLPTGFLADTLEVAAAKEKHLSALAEAKTAEDLWRAKQAQHKPWN